MALPNWPAASDGDDDGSYQDGSEGGDLGVAHAPVEAGIDADELDEEASYAAEEEIEAGEPAELARCGSEAPEEPGEGGGEEELVDRGRLDEGVRRDGGDEGVGAHVDAPGEGGDFAIVAVAGGEAADTANSVAQGSGGGGEVEHADAGADAGKAVGFGLDALEEEHGDAGQEASEPSEASLEPVEEIGGDEEGMGPAGCYDLAHGEAEFADVLEFVPELGAEHTCDDDEGDDGEGVGVDVFAGEVVLQEKGCCYGRQPQEKSEGSQVERAYVDVWIHFPRLFQV